METGIIGSEIQFLELLLIASLVAVAVKYVRLPYTIALVLSGLGISFLGFEGIGLSEEIILFIFLPPLIFEGAIHIDLDTLKENLLSIITLAFIGLLISIFIVGYLINTFIHIPLIIALLFGAMVMPTDPVSVLAMFKKLGISKRLTTIIEGESIFNDGAGVVIFVTILSIIETNTFNISVTVIEFLKMVIMGLLIGFITGYATYRVLRQIDDHLVEVLLTGILAYGTFIICEQIHVSGVIGVLAAGLVIGNKGKIFAMSPKTRIAIQESWELAAFIINSLIFLMIGTQIPMDEISGHLSVVGISILVVIIARAVSVYLPMFMLNLKLRNKIPISWIHVINWSGLHGSIPIALMLSLSESSIEYLEELYLMVFGVVLFSLVFQGLSIEILVRKLGLVERKTEIERYEGLLAEKIAMTEALNELEMMREKRETPSVIYREIKEDTETELKKVKQEIDRMLEEHKEIKEMQFEYAKKRILLAKKATIHNLLVKGVINNEIADRIISEIDYEIDKLEEQNEKNPT